MSGDPVAAITRALVAEQIVPDVIPDPSAFTPTVLFSVVYPNGAEVNLGNEMTVAETQDEPEIRLAPLAAPWGDGSAAGALETSYTLAMLDPDAPFRAEPQFRSFRHWVVTGLKAPPVAANTTEALNALKTHPATCPYRAPGPRPNSGMHRYTFLLFQEPADKAPFLVPQGEVEHGAALEERRSWNPMAFAEKHGLKLVGANYFLVQSPTE
ncbi:PEBP-like protein [Epithele typhae]|uniref:PEBP-like protein n=1 Tax=Epithele typhae TaxID=378194 RepID=UPI00200893CB|nr:PEBP-like protein [Epithele typhae]KAH9913696.1 PEBP-like protein [Epithele typhae]